MTLGEQAIPVFLVNLARRTDRLERVSAHLEMRSIEFERIDACDGQNAAESVLDEACADRGPLGLIGPGPRACAVSHCRAWERFLAGPASHAVFLEDDITVAADMASLLRNFDWIPADAAAIKLEKYNLGISWVLMGGSVGKTPSGRDIHPLLSRHSGTGAYLLSRAGAERGLRERGRLAVPIDHGLFNATVSRLARDLHPLVVRPGMATQFAVPYSSDMWDWQSAAARPPSRKRKGLRSLRRGANEIRRLPWQLGEMLFGSARLLALEYQEMPLGYASEDACGFAGTQGAGQPESP